MFHVLVYVLNVIKLADQVHVFWGSEMYSFCTILFFNVSMNSTTLSANVPVLGVYVFRVDSQGHKALIKKYSQVESYIDDVCLIQYRKSS